jgi:hypothetical protein
MPTVQLLNSQYGKREREREKRDKEGEREG